MTPHIFDRLNFYSWHVEASQVAPYKVHIAEEKLKIDRSTLRSIKNLTRVNSNAAHLIASQCLSSCVLENIEFVFVDNELNPFFIKKDTWIVDISPSPVTHSDALQENIRLDVKSKSFLKKCVCQTNYKWSKRLIDSQTKLELIHLLYERGDIHVNEGLRKCLEKIPVDQFCFFDFEESSFSCDNWFKLPAIESSIQPITDHFRIDPEYLISEAIEPSVEEIKLPSWKCHDWRLDEVIPLKFLLEEIDINSGKFFLPIERIHEVTGTDPENIQTILPSWHLGRLKLANMEWGIFKGLLVEQLNDELTFLPKESPRERKESSLELRSSLHEIPSKNQLEISEIGDISETSPGSAEMAREHTFAPSSLSMETCKGETIQEITKAPEFADSAFLNPVKRSFEQTEETSLEFLVKNTKKKKRTSSTVFEANGKFPIDTVLEFTQYIALPKKKSKTVLEEDETVALSSEVPPCYSTDSFTIIGRKSIVMNISLYKKERILFDLIQELKKTGHLQVQEQELPFADMDFDIFLNPSTGILTMPSKQINQFDVFTGCRLSVQQLMNIAHQCTDIIVIIVNIQASNKIDGLEDFVKVMNLNKIKTMVVTSEDYLYKVCELVNEYACEVIEFEDEEKSLEAMFLQECNIWNPLLIKEILFRDSLENFISMGDESRALKYKDIMTYEMLNSINEIILNEFLS